MPYACHKCGSMIDEGTSFCPHCGAPQIRVAMPESEPEPPPRPTQAPATAPQPMPPISFPPSTPSTFRWRMALRPIVVGGMVILIGSMAQLGAFWNLLVIIAGAIVAVALYRRNPFSSGEVSPGLGAKIGAAAATFSFSVTALLLVAGCVFDGPEIRQKFMEYFQTVQTQIADPQARARFDSILQTLKTPDGFATMITLVLGISLIFFLVLGATGGALGAMLLGRSQKNR